jgi:hypothetical protein
VIPDGSVAREWLTARHLTRLSATEPQPSSHVQPDDDCSEDDHGAIIDGTFFIACSQPAPLLQPIDAALDHVAPGVDRRVEDQRTPWLGIALCPLITTLWDSVRNLSCPQQPTTARVAVALISDDAIWQGAWAPASAWSQFEQSIIQLERNQRKAASNKCLPGHSASTT